MCGLKGVLEEDPEPRFHLYGVEGVDGVALLLLPTRLGSTFWAAGENE